MHAACERGAWRCTQFLVTERTDEIHILKDEYYPVHYAVLHDSKFLELLINAGADTTVRTCTQQMTLLHAGEYFSPTLSLSINCSPSDQSFLSRISQRKTPFPRSDSCWITDVKS